MTRRKPLDPDLYAAVVDEAKTRFAVWPSAYASGWVVKTYKARGGRYAGQGRKESTGLTKWFGEEWVDLSRPTADGSYEPCGRKRSDAPFDAAQYPKCRPLKEALRMSPDEVKDAIKRKRAAEAKASKGRGGRGARAPVRVATYRVNPDTEAFRRWFGDSEVVDERGEPLVVYHGSPSAIVGDFRQSKQAFYGPEGIYFTNRRDVAEHFGEHVTPVFLSLQNPYYDDGSKDVSIQSLKRKGYDGIVFETDFLDEDADGELMLVAFHPEQVRRADQRGRGSRARAPKRVATYQANPLADLPVVDTEEWDDGTVVEFVAVPFPYERKPLAHRDDPTARGPVPLADLIATQRRVTKVGVMGAGDAPITVLQTTDGRRYIADGHHRAVAAWLRGDDTIPAVVQFVRENPAGAAMIDGDALAAWCASDESYAVLDETASAGSSWMAGACVLLAKALVATHPEAQLVGLEVDGDVQHVGALVGDVVYDALGAHRERRWARDWLAYEQLDPRTPARLVSLPPGVPASALPDAEAPATARDVRLVARALPA